MANRIQFIHSVTNPSQWRYVPSKINPADDLSRGMTIEAFLQNQRWKYGPEFLMHNSCEWPPQPEFLPDLDENNAEVKRQTSAFSSSAKISHFLDSLIERFSSWDKLRRVVARILRCKQIFKKFIFPNFIPPSGYLSVQEVEGAEVFIIEFLQKKHFAAEMENLSAGKVLKKTSPLRNLDPFMEDGVVRVGGRLSAASLPYGSKHQLIVPNDGLVSEMLAKQAHELNGHAGKQHVMAALRERYWVLRANSVVRGTLRNCMKCKNNFAAPASQKMADLPADRVACNQPPFTSVGVDYFGSILVKEGRSEKKRYGVVFTCLNIRAVHIEVAYNLDTSSFTLALRRFVSRRGQVKTICSDNGTNFVGEERELRNQIKAWNQEQIYSFLLQRNVNWIFNVPGASHHGGVWERQIRSIRRILCSICNH